MRPSFKKIIPLLAVGAALVGGFIFAPRLMKPGPLDGFARCLKDRGAVFYGAFWCPHCQRQKALFGKSAKLLPYVECSTPDGRGQIQICKDKKIGGYPTWMFSDGSTQSGEITLETLSQKTGCALPQQY